MIEVVLYEGTGCGLCARARELLESEAPRLGFGLRRVLIDGDLAFTQAVAAGPLRRAVERAQARHGEATS